MKSSIQWLLILFCGLLIFCSACSNGFRNKVELNGNIEVDEARLSFKIPGKLLERNVDEGTIVSKGQLIAKLESVDQQLSVNIAEANLEYAKAVLDELNAGSRPEEISRAKAAVDQAEFRLKELKSGSRKQEIADAEAMLESATAALDTAKIRLDQAEKDYNRYQKLISDKAVTQREFEDARNRYEMAEQDYIQAGSQVKSARELLLLRKEGPREEQIEQAKAGLDQTVAAYSLVSAGPRNETVKQAEAKMHLAEVSLNQAKQVLDYTNLNSPFDGVVLSKGSEPGEFVNTGSTIVTIANLENVHMRCYINEKYLGRINLGQTVNVYTDSYPQKSYTGTISYISEKAEFTPKTVQTREERVKLMYLVKITIDNASGELKAGMPSNCTIDTRKAN
jgi:HlyD family secretion protein